MKYTTLNSLKSELLQNNTYNSVLTSQETNYFSATKTSLLMLFRETVAVYCENHMRHTNTLFERKADFLYIQVGGTYINHWTLRGFYDTFSL
jgi:hypothetical protein